jgi:outer membrane protein
VVPRPAGDFTSSSEKDFSFHFFDNHSNRSLLFEDTVKNILIVIGLIAALVFSFSIATAQVTKAAFVDSEKILGELPEAQKASTELNALVKGWQDSVASMQADLQKQFEEYQKQASVMAQLKKDAEEKRLKDLDTRMREFAAQKLDTRTGEAAQEREKRLAPIREKVLRAIETVAKEDGFTFVFDRANVLYADVKVDLTYKVIDRLKRGTAGKAK